MKKVLVVCSENACRSQMAEAYLTFYAKDKAKIQSAGLVKTKVNPIAMEVMEEDGIDIGHYSSKTLSAFQDEYFDFLITVCDEVKDKNPNFPPASRKIHLSIPDPSKYKGDPESVKEEFRKTREMTKKLMLKFIGKELIKKVPPVAA